MNTNINIGAPDKSLLTFNTNMDMITNFNVRNTGFTYERNDQCNDIFGIFSEAESTKRFTKSIFMGADNVDITLNDNKNAEYAGFYSLGDASFINDNATGNINFQYNQYSDEKFFDFTNANDTKYIYNKSNKYNFETKAVNENCGYYNEGINLLSGLNNLEYVNDGNSSYAFEKNTADIKELNNVFVDLSITGNQTNQTITTTVYCDNRETRYPNCDAYNNEYNIFNNLQKAYNDGICNQNCYSRQANGQENMLYNHQKNKEISGWDETFDNLWNDSQNIDFNKVDEFPEVDEWVAEYFVERDIGNVNICDGGVNGGGGGEGGRNAPCDNDASDQINSFVRYMRRTESAYRNHRGNDLARLLCLRDRHVRYLMANLNFDLIILEKYTVRELVPILIKHVNSFKALMMGNLVLAFAEQHDFTIAVVNLLIEPRNVHEGWTLQFLYHVAVDLRIVAQKAATTGIYVMDANTMEMTADALLRCFRACSMPHSNKEKGMRKISDQLLAVYIAMKKFDLSRPLMHNLQHLPVLPTFAYADDYLAYAWRNCPRKYEQYKYLILIRLECLKIAKGLAPSRNRLVKHGLTVVWQMYLALKSGNLPVFDKILHEFFPFFWQHGLFNFLNQQVRRVATVNAYKKIHKDATTFQIAGFDAALQVIARNHAEVYAFHNFIASYSPGAQGYYVYNNQIPLIPQIQYPQPIILPPLSNN